jgi:hypothetical protein
MTGSVHGRDKHVFVNAHALKRPGHLIGSPDPHPAALVGAFFRDFEAGKLDLAAVNGDRPDERVNMVVFPQPFGPMTPNTSPLYTSKERPLSTFTLP